MKKVIVVGSNYWNSPYQVGSHFFAKEFRSTGWEVLYISDPISLLHKIVGSKSTDLKERKALTVPMVTSEGIVTFVPDVFFTCARKPFLDSEWLLDNWWRLSRKSVSKIIEDVGFSNPDLIFFNSLSFNWMLKHYPSAKFFFRIADWNGGMSGLPRASIGAQTRLIKSSNKVFASSRAVILDHFSTPDFPAIEYLPNGVDLNSLAKNNIVPAEYNDLVGDRKKVVYVGAVDGRFDFKLLHAAALEFPSAVFFIIGRVSDPLRIKEFDLLDNVRFLGPVEFKRISGYLEYADIGLMLQSRSYEATDYFNPLKMYQYLFFGLPVVSTWWKELDFIGAPIFIGRTDIEFLAHLRLVIKDGYSPRVDCADFVSKHTWRNSFKVIQRAIES